MVAKYDFTETAHAGLFDFCTELVEGGAAFSRFVGEFI